MSDQTLPQVVQDDVRSLVAASAWKTKVFTTNELEYWNMLAIGILWHGCQVAVNQNGTPAADAWISGVVEEFRKHAARLKMSVEVRPTRPRKRK